jgi:hypothetical protein
MIILGLTQLVFSLIFSNIVLVKVWHILGWVPVFIYFDQVGNHPF